MEELFSLIPPIKRARGFRLYAFNGRRYLDLWLSGGHNFLGHKPPQYVNYLKQAAERGAIADIPSIYARRFRNALSALFPDYQSFLFASTLPGLLETASRLLKRPLSMSDIIDPLFSETVTSQSIARWRPLCPNNIMADLLLPVIPSGFGPNLFALCSRTPLPDSAPPPVSALVLACAAQRLNRLKDLPPPAWCESLRFTGAPYFIRHGLYLAPRCRNEEYAAVFKRFLNAGVLLSPHPYEPSVLPLEVSPGEWELLQKLLSEN